MSRATMPSYAQAVESLYALGHELHAAPDAPRRKWDLAYMRTLCAALGHPHQVFPSVLIAGTNGKGSTAATLASILQSAGYTTGLYTSPHLVRVNERIRINSTDISDDDFASTYSRVVATADDLVRSGHLPHPPSFFEAITALAFTYFAAQQIDIAILEVGMGGRLDATNIVSPALSVITDISLDHTDYLGDTLTAIATEKAGILRPNGLLVTLPQHPQANHAISTRAVELNVTGINAAEFMPARRESKPEDAASSSSAYPLTVLGSQIEIRSPLTGPHQQRNLALAIASAVALSTRGFPLSATHIADGIRTTRWPGRLERISIPGSAPFLLDAAHNPAAIWALRSALSALPDSQPRTLIFSCLRDKALAEMAQILLPNFRTRDTILIPPIHTPRAADVSEILAAALSVGVAAQPCQSVASAVSTARSITPHNGLIIATGSVYLIGEVRALLTATPAEAQP